MRKRRETSIGNVRVIGIFAHVDAGKTTTSESILYYTGRIHRIGRVDEGNTQLDWMAQERQRGITITSAATACSWDGHAINLIDTPGHIDFSAEVIRALRVIDGSVVVLCGVGGVEAQTETVWMQADNAALPRVVFINKLDRPGASFNAVMADVRERLTPRAVALHLPIGSEGAFVGMVDLIREQALIWREGNDEPAVQAVPADLADEVAAARAELLDAICDTDDGLLELRLEGRDPGPAEVDESLRRATVSGHLVPVLAGSALKHIGVQPLLDAVITYLPAPLEGPPVRSASMAGDDHEVGQRGGPEAPFWGTTFKIVTDRHVGRQSWVRIYAGRLEPGDRVMNVRTGEQERVGRIYRMHANRREQIARAEAGDVVALVGVRSAGTGDVLCDPEHPVESAAFNFPEPVLSVAFTPVTDDETDKLNSAVMRVCDEDPTLVARFDPETGEQMLAGMGALHLEVAVSRLKSEFGVVAEVSPPRISYRETVLRAAEGTGVYQKQSGGHGHYAKAKLRVEPLDRGAGIAFVNSVSSKGPSGATRARHAGVPAEFLGHVELGVREALEKGPLAGYAVTDVRVCLLDGAYHKVDTCGMDFRIAASMATRDVVRRARPALLEPVMRLDIDVREKDVGSIAAFLAKRRGNVQDISIRGNVHRIVGEAPLAELHGCATDLRTLTGGRCTFTLGFSRYDLVPERIAEAVVRERLERPKAMAGR